MATLDENGVLQFEYGDRIQTSPTIYESRDRAERQRRKAEPLGERYGAGVEALTAFSAERIRGMRHDRHAARRHTLAMEQSLSQRTRPSQFGGPGALPFET